MSILQDQLDMFGTLRHFSFFDVPHAWAETRDVDAMTKWGVNTVSFTELGELRRRSWCWGILETSLSGGMAVDGEEAGGSRTEEKSDASHVGMGSSEKENMV